MANRIIGDPREVIITRGGIRWIQKTTFEGGNIVTPPANAWDSTAGAGLVTILTTQAAAMRGKYGAQIGLPGDTLLRYGILNGMSNETQGTVQFLFNPNNIIMADGNRFNLVVLSSSGPGGTFGLVNLRFSIANNFEFNILARDDAAFSTSGPAVSIEDEVLQVKLTFKQSSAPGEDDGYFRIFVNNILLDAIENIDNDQQNFSELQVGAAGGLDVETDGIIYFDDVSWTNKII